MDDVMMDYAGLYALARQAADYARTMHPDSHTGIMNTDHWFVPLYCHGETKRVENEAVGNFSKWCYDHRAVIQADQRCSLQHTRVMFVDDGNDGDERLSAEDFSDAVLAAWEDAFREAAGFPSSM